MTTETLSRSLEDYLEAIYTITSGSNKVRVKDIAAHMNVKMPSVTAAIKSLQQKGFADHLPYESIELTPKGMEYAKAVSGKHVVIRDFLVNTLGLNKDNAEIEACSIEHAISPETLARLVIFADRVKSSSVASECVFVPTEIPTDLSQLCPGMKGKIISVQGKGPIRKRIMDMGLTNGTDFEVIRVAPLGDPVEIKIRDYLLTLRMSEAANIKVKVA